MVQILKNNAILEEWPWDMTSDSGWQWKGCKEGQETTITLDFGLAVIELFTP